MAETAEASVTLVALPADALRALAEGDLACAGRLVDVDFPRSLLSETWVWRLRLEQLSVDPSSAPWSVRAVVRHEDNQAVGHAGFHGRPDVRGALEVGYMIVPGERRRGYGTAALRQLLSIAAGHEDVRSVRARVDPDNDASIAVLRALGFRMVGDLRDEAERPELTFTRAAR